MMKNLMILIVIKIITNYQMNQIIIPKEKIIMHLEISKVISQKKS